MKKLLTLILICFISTSFAQEIVLSYNGNPITDYDTIHVNVDDINGINTYFIDIENTSSETLNLMVSRDDISLVEGANTEFCVPGYCFTQNTSLFSFELAAGAILSHATNGENAFHVNYRPNGNYGTSLLFFSLYDETNSIISTHFYIEINAPQQIENFNSQSNTLSAYPNPASGNVTINVNLSENSQSPTFLIFRNLIGAEIYSQEINPQEHEFKVLLNDIPSGVYFYTIEQNGRKLATKKLVVK